MAKAGKSIPIYEDGMIIRDFVYIDDVAHAIVHASESGIAVGDVLDVGAGVATSINELATEISARYRAIAPHVTGQFRNGDVRSAHTRVDHTKSVLGWSPQISLSDGIARLSTWIEEQGLNESF